MGNNADALPVLVLRFNKANMDLLQRVCAVGGVFVDYRDENKVGKVESVQYGTIRCVCVHDKRVLVLPFNGAVSGVTEVHHFGRPVMASAIVLSPRELGKAEASLLSSRIETRARTQARAASRMSEPKFRPPRTIGRSA